MRLGLAKADARIDHDMMRPHPGLLAILGPPLQKAPDLADHIRIFKLALFILGVRQGIIVHKIMRHDPARPQGPRPGRRELRVPRA